MWNTAAAADADRRDMMGIAVENLEKAVGMKVWFRTKSTIADINTGYVAAVKNEQYVQISRLPDEKFVTVNVDDIYERKQDLIGANYNMLREETEKYKKDIHSVEDLLRFCFRQMESLTEYRGDDNAYASLSAVREKAKELLNIEVDPEAARIADELELAELDQAVFSSIGSSGDIRPSEDTGEATDIRPGENME